MTCFFLGTGIESWRESNRRKDLEEQSGAKDCSGTWPAPGGGELGKARGETFREKRKESEWGGKE